MSSHLRNIHKCSLKVLISDKLFPLPPNASSFRRCLRFLRMSCALNPRSIKCRSFFRNRSTMLAEQKRHARGPWFIIHPFSAMSFFLEIFFFYVWVANIVLLSFVFFQLDRNFFRPFMIAHWINSILQWIIFVSFFFQGYVDHKHKTICTDLRQIIHNYTKTYFIFDLVAVAGDDLLVWYTEKYGRDFILIYVSTNIFIIAHLIRFSTLLKILRSFGDSYNFSRAVKLSVHHYTVITILIQIFSAQVYYIPYIINNHKIPKDSWLYKSSLYKKGRKSYYDIYFETFLMVMCYFFGATFSIYSIQRVEEEFIFMLIGMFGRLYTLFALADLLSAFGLVGVSQSKYEHNLSQLQEYMNSNHLPSELRVRVLTYYEYKLQKRYFNETQINRTLSDHLKSELFLYGARKLIEKAKVLKQLPKVTLGALFAHMNCEVYLTNDMITDVGQPVERLFFISSGTVAIFNGEGIEICHLEDGDEFGFLSMFTAVAMKVSGHQKYRHVAVETTEIYSINYGLMLDFLSDFPDILKYFWDRCQQRLKLYSEAELNYRRGKEDFLSKLREGSILEKRRLRVYYD